jgi:5-methylcytosine-specific restriction endonuclease McrA
MKANAGKYVKVKDVQEYCSNKHKQVTGHVFGDPPRPFEILRKDRLPLEWDEFKVGKDKFVKYAPHKKLEHSQEILDAHSNRADGFSKKVIEEKLQQYGYKCAITGLPVSEGKLAADHWIPKEQGGKSEPGNCVILNKVLNEKKNNMMPTEWFCEGPLDSFLNICIGAGMDKEKVAQAIIEYVQKKCVT